MIDFNINNIGFNIQLIPIYGLSLGVLYYNPNLEPEPEDLNQDEFYQQLTFMFLFFGIHITWYEI